MKKNKKPVELRGRGDWGMVKPVTKVIPNKKKNRKEHKWGGCATSEGSSSE